MYAYDFLQKFLSYSKDYCQEAVDSAEIVALCPTSKKEWDKAAIKKNCSRIASLQNCTSVDQFKYHCVIDGFRKETLELCAPQKIIFGRFFFTEQFCFMI